MRKLPESALPDLSRVTCSVSSGEAKGDVADVGEEGDMIGAVLLTGARLKNARPVVLGRTIVRVG